MPTPELTSSSVADPGDLVVAPTSDDAVVHVALARILVDHLSSSGATSRTSY